MDFTLVKGNIICNLSYFGYGVVHQQSYNTKTKQNYGHPIYRDDKRAAYTLMIKEASRMLNDGWEIAND